MPKAIYGELRDKLAEFIRERKINGKLPGVHKLAAELGAHHATIRKAEELLVKSGVLEIRPSHGTFVLSHSTGHRRHRAVGIVGFYGTRDFQERIFNQIDNCGCGLGAFGIFNLSNTLRDNPRLLLQFPVDGFIFLGSSSSRRMLEILREAGIPAVCAVNDAFPETNQVGNDDMGAYDRILELLLERGCRKIAYASYSRPPDFSGFLDGIRNVFRAKLGSAFDPELFRIYDNRSSYLLHGESCPEFVARDSMEHWKDAPPDAVVSASREISAFRKLCPRLITADCRIPCEHSDADISAVSNVPQLIAVAVERIAELLDGDRSVRVVKIPLTITEKNGAYH